VASSSTWQRQRPGLAHTWASHASDAMRIFAMGLHLTTAWAPGAIKRNIKGIV
jgi:hypothetical protein